MNDREENKFENDNSVNLASSHKKWVHDAPWHTTRMHRVFNLLLHYFDNDFSEHRVLYLHCSPSNTPPWVLLLKTCLSPLIYMSCWLKMSSFWGRNCIPLHYRIHNLVTPVPPFSLACVLLDYDTPRPPARFWPSTPRTLMSMALLLPPQCVLW